MDEASSRRFQSVRKKTRALLVGGEQPHVEFKTEVPKSIALQAAAGANLVALDPSVDVHTILLGVGEETLPNGSTRGHVVGCLHSEGSVNDLDQLRLQVEQKIRDNVTPPPRITIFEENVGSATPILVVEVRPTDPPHRVGDRYPIRGSAGVQPLTQHDALLLFRNQRTQAWIDELEDSNPLLTILQTLQANYQDLAFRVSDAAMSYEDVWVDEMERTLAQVEKSIDAVHERLGALHSDVDDLQSEIEAIADPMAAIDSRTEELIALSPERAWFQLRDRREMRWFTLNQHAGYGDYCEDDLATIEQMVRDHFGDDPLVSDYAANLAEFHGYNIGFDADDDDQPHLEVVATFISAAIARAGGLPARFTRDWIDEGIASRRDVTSLIDDVRSTRSSRARRPTKPVRREMGVIQLSANGVQALAEHHRATTRPDSLLIMWPTDQGVILCARRPGCETVPVMYQPTWGSVLTRKGKPRTAQLGTAFRKLVDSYGGDLLRVDGPGVVLGGRTASATG